MNMKINRLLLFFIIVVHFICCSSDNDNPPIEINPQNVIGKWISTEILHGNTWTSVDTTKYFPACLFLTKDGYFWTEGMIYKNGGGKYRFNGNIVTTTDGKQLCRFENLTAFTAQAYVSDGEGNTLQLRFQRDETARYLCLEPKEWLVGTWRIDDVQGGIAEFTDTQAKIIYGDIVLNTQYGRVSSAPKLIVIRNPNDYPSFLIRSADLSITPNIMYLDLKRDGNMIPCRKIN